MMRMGWRSVACRDQRARRKDGCFEDAVELVFMAEGNNFVSLKLRVVPNLVSPFGRLSMNGIVAKR